MPQFVLTLLQRFRHLLRDSIAARDLSTGRALHALYLKSLVPNSTYLSNHFVLLYSRCGDLPLARRAFDEILHPNVFSHNAILSAYACESKTPLARQIFLRIPDPDLVSYNTLLSAYATEGDAGEASQLFYHMLEVGMDMDGFTVSSLLSVLPSGVDRVHSLVVTAGFDSYVSVANALISGYSRSGALEEARRVFDEMGRFRDEVSWNCMIMAYGKHGQRSKAVGLFQEMVRRGCFEVDVFTLASVLTAFTTVEDLTGALQFHAQLVKTARHRNPHVGTGLVDVYSKCRRMVDAEKVFDEVINPDLILWNALLSGYVVSNEFSDRSLLCFRGMLRAGLRVDDCSFISAISACSNLSSPYQGKQMHSLVLKSELPRGEVVVNNALIGMYSRFGNLGDARQLFERMADRDIISFNSMISGYAQHGLGTEALALFTQMLESDSVAPTSVTFVSVLSSCAHTGRVEEGWNHFISMQERYGIAPGEKHYTCMIDLLGRAGEFEKAEKLIETMPFSLDYIGWTALLSACRTHGNFELGVKAAGELIRLDPSNAGAYATLSNMYARMGRWEEATRVRKQMEDRGLKKKAGYSWNQGEEEGHGWEDEDVRL